MYFLYVVKVNYIFVKNLLKDDFVLPVTYLQLDVTLSHEILGCGYAD